MEKRKYFLNYRKKTGGVESGGWKNGGAFCFLVESGGDSPFLVEKSLENQAFSVKKILRKSVFWGCIFKMAVLQCG